MQHALVSSLSYWFGPSGTEAQSLKFVQKPNFLLSEPSREIRKAILIREIVRVHMLRLAEVQIGSMFTAIALRHLLHHPNLSLHQA
jgi:hypothetical protein